MLTSFPGAPRHRILLENRLYDLGFVRASLIRVFAMEATWLFLAPRLRPVKTEQAQARQQQSRRRRRLRSLDAPQTGLLLKLSILVQMTLLSGFVVDRLASTLIMELTSYGSSEVRTVRPNEPP